MARPGQGRQEGTSFGEIRAYRLKHKLTQLQMAHILDMTRNAYANEESACGEAPVQAWQRFSAYKALPRPAEEAFSICLVWNGDVFVPTDTRATTRQCAWCGEPFWTTVHNKKFCSHEHYRLNKNAVRRKQ